MSQRVRNFLGFLSILFLSLCTYMPGYQNPASLFWDENFHIASAQRYLNGVFFMEPHPPLGKLLIAGGEALLHANDRNDQFIAQETAKDLPTNFSFAGYRLLPVLLAALVAPLLYLIVIVGTERFPIAITLALAPALDNGLIVHNRGAMLEGPQLFFILITLLAFIRIKRSFASSTRAIIFWIIFLGVASACALLIKINSAAILLLPVFLFVISETKVRFALIYAISFSLTYFFVWQIHFALGTKIEPKLDNGGYFAASPELRASLKRGGWFEPGYILYGIRDSFAFSRNYQDGVPSLNYCKSDENGSYPLLWPLGGRTIQYRWDDSSEGTRYLYLVPNPVGWFFALCGIIGGCIFIGARLFGLAPKTPYGPEIALLTILYMATWLAPLSMPRVFYLYHYFVPLTYGWILLGFVCANISQGFFAHKITQKLLPYVSITLLVGAFIFFRPFTYHLPIRDKELMHRSWLSLWDLRCKNCDSITPFAHPLTPETTQRRTDPSWKITLNGLRASYIEQSIGAPQQLENGIRIMTKSKVQFSFDRKFKRFSGRAVLPKDHLDSDLEFKIVGDGVDMWSSGILTAEHPENSFDLPIHDTRVVVLIVKTAKDSDLPGTGEWLNLSLMGDS